MAITRTFLETLDNASIAASKALGVHDKSPNGAVSVDPEDAVLDIHDAAVELLRAIEALHNWAWEVTGELKSRGVDLVDE